MSFKAVNTYPKYAATEGRPEKASCLNLVLFINLFYNYLMNT